jgi:hypothetical protein
MANVAEVFIVEGAVICMVVG